MGKQAILIFGAPGSGKGTQANLLAWTKGFYHFDSGKHLRMVLKDPANQNKKIIERERTLNDAGILNTPSWVLEIFKKETEKIAKAGMSIVCSGSPRTLYEAYGDPSAGLRAGKKTIGFVPFLQKLYGKKNVHAIHLVINPDVAAGRNKIRRICTVCTTPILGDTPVTRCPICQGELKIRVDDDPTKFKTRIKEYKERTTPILAELKNHDVSVTDINAEQSPPAVYADIIKAFNL